VIKRENASSLGWRRFRVSKKFFQPKDSEGRIVGKGTVRVPFP